MTGSGKTGGRREGTGEEGKGSGGEEHQLAVNAKGESNGIPPDGNTPERGYHTEDAPGTAEIQGSIQDEIITGTTDESNGIPGDPAGSPVILSPATFNKKSRRLENPERKLYVCGRLKR